MAENGFLAEGPQERLGRPLRQRRRQSPLDDAHFPGSGNLGQFGGVGLGGEAQGIEPIVVGLKNVELEGDRIAVAELPQPDGAALLDDDRRGIALRVIDPGCKAGLNHAGTVTPTQGIGIPQRQKENPVGNAAAALAGALGSFTHGHEPLAETVHREAHHFTAEGLENVADLAGRDPCPPDDIFQARRSVGPQIATHELNASLLDVFDRELDALKPVHRQRVVELIALPPL